MGGPAPPGAHAAQHLMGRNSCPVDTKPREARTRAQRTTRQEGKGSGRGLGGGQCTLGGDVRACRLVGGESRQGSAERMQCNCGKRPLGCS